MVGAQVGEELFTNFQPRALSALRANELVDDIDFKATQRSNGRIQ